MDYAVSSGLALSSGVNAYLPLLSFSIAARWFKLYEVNPNFSYITHDWFLIGLAILALADLFADKIPYVDHVWDLIHTVLRPIAGALVAAASNSDVSGAGLAVPMVLGGTLAGISHVTKAATRAASTATTGGLLNTILSIVEDVVMVIGVVLSLLLPVVMVVLVVLFVLFFIFTAPRIVRTLRKRKLRNQQAAAPTIT